METAESVEFQALAWMIQTNITFQRFGHGFYLAPNSSKCHDYTQGANGCRAMLLCDVCPGRQYQFRTNVSSWNVHLQASIVCMDKLGASWTILRLLSTVQMLSCHVTSLFIERTELDTLLQTNQTHTHTLLLCNPSKNIYLVCTLILYLQTNRKHTYPGLLQ